MIENFILLGVEISFSDLNFLIIDGSLHTFFALKESSNLKAYLEFFSTLKEAPIPIIYLI